MDAVVDLDAVDVDRGEMRGAGGTTGRAVEIGGDRRGTSGERRRRQTAVGIDERIDGVRRRPGMTDETIGGVRRRRDITIPGVEARRETTTTREADITTIDTRVDRRQGTTTIVIGDIIRHALRRADHRRRTTTIVDVSRLDETRMTTADRRHRVTTTLAMDPRTFWIREVTMASS